MRLGPQGREKIVAFDFHALILEGVSKISTSFLNSFVASVAPGGIEIFFSKPPPESKDPNGMFKDTTGRKIATISGFVFYSFHIVGFFGGLWHMFGKGCRKGPKPDPPKS